MTTVVNPFEVFEQVTGTKISNSFEVREVTPDITLAGENKAKVTFPYNPAAVAKIREIPGRKWVGSEKANYTKICPQLAEFAREFNLTMSDEVKTKIDDAAQEQMRERALTDKMLALSFAEEGEIDIDGAALEPRPYQAAGIQYALINRRTFIADEMGLGKTPTAVFATWKAKATPTLVVVPDGIKSNWEREIGKFLPEATVEILHTQTPYEISDADYVVIGYAILSYWVEALKAHGFKAAVFDESHYIKNADSRKVTDENGQVVKIGRKILREYKTQRVRAAIEVAHSIPQEGMVLLLTGTPVLNRPIELPSQLDALGLLDEFGGFWNFAKKYCGAKDDGYGWDFSGATNSTELNERMRRKCFVRRLKVNVEKDLPPKQHIPKWIDLPSSALVEYNEIAGPEIQLETISTLRRLLGEAKIESAVQWINEFLDENPDESLVVFAHHVEVQKQIAEATNALWLRGARNDDEIMEMKDQFQAGENRVIVLSIQADREGHTLTRASTMLFVEQAWTPGEMQQAQDRIHRIGQEAEHCFYYYLLAVDTIDEIMHNILARKTVITNRVNNGEYVSAEELALLDEDMKKMIHERLATAA